MASKAVFRFASRAGRGRARARCVPFPRPVSPRADALDDRLVEEALGVPAPLVPAQWVAGVRHDSTLSGEKALLLAVLEDGIRCFQKHGRSPHALAADAEAWITAVGDDHPGSFEQICEALGFDPGRLRRALLAAREMSPHGTETVEHPPRLTSTVPRAHVGTPPVAVPSRLSAAGAAPTRRPDAEWTPGTGRRTGCSADRPRPAS